jgi:hypothetical protein
MDAIEVLYFQRQGFDLKGYHTDDLYEALSETRIDSGSIERRLSQFEEDISSMYSRLNEL